MVNEVTYLIMMVVYGAILLAVALILNRRKRPS